MSILRLDNVVKRFGDFTAVNDLTFAVPEGGIFGFLGGNGAGKTTSLRMALDIIRPTSGSIEILGRKPGRENASQIGFLPEERGLYRRMTVLDTIVYFGRLKGMDAADAKKEAERLIERFGLGEWTKSMVEKLSKGMSQKVQVAAAMVNKPRLLILDEPFSGLDPVNQKVLEDLVLEMAQAGSTVVFSTHIMQHAERLTRPHRPAGARPQGLRGHAGRSARNAARPPHAHRAERSRQPARRHLRKTLRRRGWLEHMGRFAEARRNTRGAAAGLHLRRLCAARL